MRIDACDWSMVEAQVAKDDRCVVPLGCTEQHAGLSLATDSILAERVAIEAATPLGVPVFPVLAYGVTPSFMAYPGTVSLRLSTYGQVLTDLLDSVSRHGFNRILLVNGHGGNTPARTNVTEWVAQRGVTVVWHDWWCAPKTWAKVLETDPDASHASWMENFPWTRLRTSAPQAKKPMVDAATLRTQTPEGVRRILGDGSFGGLYELPDEEMLALWRVAVDETRGLIESL